MSPRQVQQQPVISKERIDLVNAALRSLSDAQAVIQKLENLGHDVSHYRQMSAHWDEKLRAIIKEFGGS